ncbi:MAG: RNA polymerase sigma factor, partial [Kofleriaceae bacterium]
MRDESASDVELITASRKGDAVAFGEIVRRYHRSVCAVAYSGTRDVTLSEDVAQDTFITAWQTLTQLREVERLQAWLCGIARNRARLARQRRGRELEADDTELVAEGTPFDAVSQREDEVAVAAALSRVPDAYREPLVLLYTEGSSVKAVATALGISEDATHQRLSRGRHYLAGHVQDLVERTLRRRRTNRDLVAVVTASIVVAGASPARAGIGTMKGSTMWKLASSVTVFVAITGAGFVASSQADGRPARPNAPQRDVRSNDLAPADRRPPITTARTAPALPALRSIAAAPSPVSPDRPTITLGADNTIEITFPGCPSCTLEQLATHYAARLRAADRADVAEAMGRLSGIAAPVLGQLTSHAPDEARVAIVDYTSALGLDLNDVAASATSSTN